MVDCTGNSQLPVIIVDAYLFARINHFTFDLSKITSFVARGAGQPLGH